MFGLIPSQQNTRMYFTTDDACTVNPDIALPSNIFIVLYTSTSSQINPFLVTGTYYLCVGTYLQNPFVLQTLPGAVMTVLATPATNTSIQQMSPPYLYAGSVESTPVIFVGAVPSSETLGSLTFSDCSDANRLGQATITSETTNLTAEIPVGTYKVCYSTRPNIWFLQSDETGTPITFEVKSLNGTVAQPNDIVGILAGSIVGAVCLLLALIGVILAFVWYRRSKRNKKFEVFAQAPETQPSFLSDNPIFESSPMYQSTTKDPFKK